MRFHAFLLGAWALLATATAAGQPRPGDASGAMPGYHRVGAVAPGGAVATIAATAGFGIIEALPTAAGPEPSGHTVLRGTLAGAVRPTEWLGLYLRLDGRYVAHPDDAMGADSS